TRRNLNFARPEQSPGTAFLRLRHGKQVDGVPPPPPPCCGIGSLGDSRRSRSTKEESQPPVRAKVGATLVPGRKSESIIMKADLIAAASEVITNQQILVNMVSRRVRQLSLGHRPLVEYAPGLREADIALTEIANGKLTFESTFGQNGTAEVPAKVVL